MSIELDLLFRDAERLHFLLESAGVGFSVAS